jgi:GAF domain-containing protein/anti-sigma regulatory factor (Ser/Thr protein kinase)
MTCPRCHQVNSTGQKLCKDCGTPLNGAGAAGESSLELPADIEGLRRSLAEALERETATSGILRVISRSPTGVQPVLDAMAESALRLCAAHDAVIFRVDGEVLRPAAHAGPLPPSPSVAPPVTRSTVTGSAVLDGQPVHVADLQAESETYPTSRALARQVGFRTMLSAPLLREGVAIGAIDLRRSVVQPFTPTQIGLLQIFADQAVIAIESARLLAELEARNAELRESLAQQTATGVVLKLISRSTFDLRPVLQTLVENATRLAGAEGGLIARIDGGVLRFLADHGARPEYREYWQRNVIRPGRDSVVGRVALDRHTVHIVDILTDPDFELHEAQRIAGYRSVLAVPIVREDELVGVFFMWRTEARPFTDRQIEFVTTFADEAGIAIENTRLLGELQSRNADLTELLEQQTATAEILRVISQSLTDVRPVFGTIVQNARALCEGDSAAVLTYDGEQLHIEALVNPDPERAAVLRHAYPMPATRGHATGRAILTRRPVYIPDVREDPEYALRAVRDRAGLRSITSVPMIRDGVPIGAITVQWWVTPRAFSAKRMALLQTFADQAVIAIENVRLFNETREALEQQTATGEILRVISHSPTDIRPVFDAIAESAARLCNGIFGIVYRLDGTMVHMVAHHNATPEGWAAYQALYPRPLSRQTNSGRAMLDGQVAITEDVEADPERSAAARDAARLMGLRSAVTVPLLREERTIGALTVGRAEAGGFSSKEVALLQTFARQAVIAIENVRLFTELEARTRDLTRSVGELRALSEVGQAISSTLDLRTVLSAIVARATQLSGTDAGVIYEYDEFREVFLPRATEHLEEEIVDTMLATPVRKGEGVTGQLPRAQRPVQVPDIVAAPAESRVRGALVRAGYRALLAVPLLREDHLLGALTVIRKAPGEFAPEVIELLRTFATQSAVAIQNARLFQQIEAKSRELQVASQHKSEFLANMSHELRTPLNAIIGYSELLEEEAGDLDGGRLVPDLEKIATAAKHQLSLINDILDLSKIEAGRMELEPTDFDLPTAIDNALTLVRERATRRGITLGRTTEDRIGVIQGDERKVKQVLLNLLSNALKFTPEGGRIEVRAAVSEGLVEVSVTDTGAGIASEDQEAIFEEFRQVGRKHKNVEGTGLGLALSRKFVELHGGRIWVKSQVGQGSTFTFTLPAHRSGQAGN